VIADTAAQSLRDIRALTRELQPYEMEHVGLGEAVKAMVRGVGDASGVAFTTEIDPIAPRPAADLINLFRIVQEAVNNVVKHAGATECVVKLREGPLGLEVRVTDNGRGLPVPAPRPREGFGMRSLATRAQMLGGVCRVESTPGRGTSVTVRVPAAQGAGHS
jgi:signal transduction histidine kinase